MEIQVLHDTLSDRSLTSSVMTLHHGDGSSTSFYHLLPHFDELRSEFFELGLVGLLVEL